MSRNVLILSMLLATGVAMADEPPAAGKPDHGATEAKGRTDATGAKAPADATDPNAPIEQNGNLGMSILGNQEAPKALVIVPWKSSEPGKSFGISTMLDESRQPVDKEVFMRMLSYYELMSSTTHHDGAPAGGRTAAAETDAAQPATAAHRR